MCPERIFKEFYHVSSSTSSHVTTHTVPFMLVVPKGKSKRGSGGGGLASSNGSTCPSPGSAVPFCMAQQMLRLLLLIVYPFSTIKRQLELAELNYRLSHCLSSNLGPPKCIQAKSATLLLVLKSLYPFSLPCTVASASLSMVFPVRTHQ